MPLLHDVFLLLKPFIFYIYFYILSQQLLSIHFLLKKTYNNNNNMFLYNYVPKFKFMALSREHRIPVQAALLVYSLAWIIPGDVPNYWFLVLYNYKS